MKRSFTKGGAVVIRTTTTIRDVRLQEAFAALGFLLGKSAPSLATALVEDGLRRRLRDDAEFAELAEAHYQETMATLAEDARAAAEAAERRKGFRVVDGDGR